MVKMGLRYLQIIKLIQPPLKLKSLKQLLRMDYLIQML
ncbi:hypothetical protein Q674_14870 [Acinetobacter sp. COS3]|nr:hypothetical protein Q674_14870 [Acinetobacter sp. COS3]